VKGPNGERLGDPLEGDDPREEIEASIRALREMVSYCGTHEVEARRNGLTQRHGHADGFKVCGAKFGGVADRLQRVLDGEGKKTVGTFSIHLEGVGLKPQRRRVGLGALVTKPLRRKLREEIRRQLALERQAEALRVQGEVNRQLAAVLSSPSPRVF
jgi:hypothetical protein